MTMAANVSDPMDTFDSWLLRHVTQAVEPGELPRPGAGDCKAGMGHPRRVRREGESGPLG